MKAKQVTLFTLENVSTFLFAILRLVADVICLFFSCLFIFPFFYFTIHRTWFAIISIRIGYVKWKWITPSSWLELYQMSVCVMCMHVLFCRCVLVCVVSYQRIVCVLCVSMTLKPDIKSLNLLIIWLMIQVIQKRENNSVISTWPCT